MRPWFAILLTGLSLQASDAFSPEGLEFFEKRIRPLLIAKCHECHSAEGGQSKGGLLLDSREGLLRGGDSGPAVVVGRFQESLLHRAVNRGDPDFAMPPKPEQALTTDEVRDIAAWIDMGLPDPRQPGAQAATPGAFDWDKERQFWSLRPIQNPAPPVRPGPAAGHNVLDDFILAALDARAIRPNPEADRTTLIRRVTFDLTGLPPTPAEVAAFVDDPSPRAYENLVDRLLASPRFGEQFGRHWLDVARYADTAGDSSDYPIPQAARYRDYVIHAFNQDKPYDQFLREQIAGDLLPARNRDERNERLTATGFIALSRRFGVGEGQFHLTIDDTIDTLSKAVLGLTVSCARCHDHKHDPVSIEDYYALHGIFRSTRYAFPGAETLQRQRDLIPLIPPEEAEQLLRPSRERLASVEETLRKLEALVPATNTTEIAVLRQQRRAVLDETPVIPAAFAVTEGHAADSPVFLRGEPWRPGPVVPRGFLTVLGGQRVPTGSTNSGRLELAGWLTDPANPLTARVMVNRVWQWHFGRGLVVTASDFGRHGQPPSHPELLDHLATRFMREGWSVKRLSRLIVTSRTYRLSAALYAPSFLADPDNTLLWRFNRRPLAAEELRDAVLAAAGNLDLDPGLDHPFPPQSRWNFTQHFQFTADYDHAKRSVYLMRQRIRRQPFLALFDGPDPNASTAERVPSISPLQALWFMNQPFVHAQAGIFADRLLAQGGTLDEQVNAAWQWALGRPPTDDERRLAVEQVEQMTGMAAKPETARREALAGLIRALFAGNEFSFLD